LAPALLDALAHGLVAAPASGLDGVLLACGRACPRVAGPVGQISRALRGGAAPDSALAEAQLVRETERELVREANDRGALPAALTDLAEQRRGRGRRSRLALTTLLYPALMLVLTVFLGPLPLWFLSGPAAYLQAMIPGLLGLGLLIGLAVSLPLLGQNITLRPLLAKAGNLLPLVGGWLRQAGLVRWARVLAQALTDGVALAAALPVAACAVGPGPLREQLLRIGPAPPDVSQTDPAAIVSLRGRLAALPAELQLACAVEEPVWSLGGALRGWADRQDALLDRRLQQLVRVVSALLLLLALALSLVQILTQPLGTPELLQSIGGQEAPLELLELLELLE